MARWDGTAWQAVGTRLNSFVYSLALAPNGDVLAAGAFTDAGANANADRVARWDGTAWRPLGTGLANLVWKVTVAPNGDVLAAGIFTDAGGNAAADCVARWDGSAWQPLGTGLNGSTGVLLVTADSQVIAGGLFTAVGDGSKSLGRIGVYVGLMAPPALTAAGLSPASGPAGTLLSLRGTNLTGATAITFAGSSTGTVTSGYTVVSATYITGVVVPIGLPSGPCLVTVTTPASISNGLSFIVGPLAAAVGTPAVPFGLYPNPARTTATATGLPPRTFVQVLDALGRTVVGATVAADGTAYLLLPAGLAAGLYVVKGAGRVQRLVVE